MCFTDKIQKRLTNSKASYWHIFYYSISNRYDTVNKLIFRTEVEDKTNCCRQCCRNTYLRSLRNEHLNQNCLKIYELNSVFNLINVKEISNKEEYGVCLCKYCNQSKIIWGKFKIKNYFRIHSVLSLKANVGTIFSFWFLVCLFFFIAVF